jgi:antitoxin component YwqK of YwqJK toxin-antitoxin module
VVLSITLYTAGKKDGHIVVRYPNDVVHYDGEYKMDGRVGLWRFYDEAGELVKQEDYGYPEN